MEWCLNDKTDNETIDVTSTARKALRGGDWGYGIENAEYAYADDDPGQIDVLNGCRLVLGQRIMDWKKRYSIRLSKRGDPRSVYETAIPSLSGND